MGTSARSRETGRAAGTRQEGVASEAYRSSWGPQHIDIQTAAATRGLPPPSSSSGALAVNLQGINRAAARRLVCTPGPHNVNSQDVFMLSRSVPSPCPTPRGHAMPNVTCAGELDSSTWWWWQGRKRQEGPGGQGQKTAGSGWPEGELQRGKGEQVPPLNAQMVPRSSNCRSGS